MSRISAHADYRYGDYHFARTQSPALRVLKWDRSAKPLHSWSEMLYPALGVAGAVLAVLEIVH